MPGFAFALAAALLLPAADGPTKVLLIGKERDHPPASHEYLAECALLAKCLAQTPGITPIVSDGWPADPKTFEGVGAIVLYTAHGGDLLFGDPARREQVEALLKKGVGLVAVHWSTDAQPGPNADKQVEHLGGWFHRPPSDIPVRDTTVVFADKAHPIARGLTDFPMKDEYYIKLKFNAAARPLITANIDGTDYVVGWTLERPGGGRSFATVCGHFHDCFGDARFRRLVTNGILWAAGREVPASGAKVEAGAADLVLPPDPRVKP
jgi:hypothetical protein